MTVIQSHHPVLEYIQPLIEIYSTGEFYPEIYKAKEEYFEKAGIAYEDDAYYEEHMSLFMDHYLFDRLLTKYDLSPASHYYLNHKDNFRSDEEIIYQDLCKTIRSLYVYKGKGLFTQKPTLIDLFTQKKYRIEPTGFETSFEKQMIIDARVIPFKKRFYFSGGFCFHPKEMNSFILKEVKKVRKTNPERKNRLILQLSQMKMKSLRFQHIDLNHIYSFDSRF